MKDAQCWSKKGSMQLIWLNVSVGQLDRLNLLLKDVAKLRPHTRAEADLSFSQRGVSAVAAAAQGVSMLSLIIGILIICVVGAICFWAIDKFVNESRLAGLLKLLVVLICLAAILQRVLPLAGINWL